jgi:hypothetical protein
MNDESAGSGGPVHDTSGAPGLPPVADRAAFDAEADRLRRTSASALRGLQQ